MYLPTAKYTELLILLQENSKLVGTYLLEQLIQLVDKYEIVGDVRGKGLMIGENHCLF